MKNCKRCEQEKKNTEFSSNWNICKDCIRINHLTKKIENGTSPYKNCDITKQKMKKAIKNKDFIHAPESDFSFKQYMIDNSNSLGIMDEHSDREIQDLLGLNYEDFQFIADRAQKQFFILLKERHYSGEDDEPQYLCPYRKSSSLDEFLVEYEESIDTVDDYEETDYDEEY